MRYEGNFFTCPNSFLEQDITINAKMVFIVLMRYADKNGQCFPSIKRIGTLASIKSPTTIHKALKELEQKGFIEKAQVKRSNGGFRANKYFINEIDAINDLSGTRV